MITRQSALKINVSLLNVTDAIISLHNMLTPFSMTVGELPQASSMLMTISPLLSILYQQLLLLINYASSWRWQRTTGCADECNWYFNIVFVGRTSKVAQWHLNVSPTEESPQVCGCWRSSREAWFTAAHNQDSNCNHSNERLVIPFTGRCFSCGHIKRLRHPASCWWVGFSAMQ